MDDSAHRLIELLIRFVDGDGRSLQDAETIEVEAMKDPLHMIDEDRLAGVAAYRPYAGPHHLDEVQMTTLCRDWLHDLGEHSRCLHDLPLTERP